MGRTGLAKIGHQLEDLFTRLTAFLEFRKTPNMNVVSGLMKFDYFLGHKYKPRKIWWDHAQDKAQWNANVRKIVEDPRRYPPISPILGSRSAIFRSMR